MGEREGGGVGIGGVGEWDPSLQSVFEFMVPAMNWSVKMPVLPFDSFLDQSGAR